MIPTVIAPHPQPLRAGGEGRQSVALAGWGSSGFSRSHALRGNAFIESLTQYITHSPALYGNEELILTQSKI